MKYLRQLDIIAKNPDLSKSIINHYRSAFLFAEPNKYSGQTPMWTVESAEKSVKMVMAYRKLTQSHKNLSDELKDWIELNRRSKECLYDRAARLMKARSC